MRVWSSSLPDNIFKSVRFGTELHIDIEIQKKFINRLSGLT